MKKQSENEIEIENILRSTADGKVPQEAIDEVISLLNTRKQEPDIDNNKESVDSIKLKLLDEPDWHKRAILSAMLISKSLENY